MAVNQSWLRPEPKERSVTGFHLTDRGAPSLSIKAFKQKRHLSFLCPQWPSHRCEATGLNQSSAVYLSHTFYTKAAEAAECALWQSCRIHPQVLSARLLIRRSYGAVCIQRWLLYTVMFNFASRWIDWPPNVGVCNGVWKWGHSVWTDRTHTLKFSMYMCISKYILSVNRQKRSSKTKDHLRKSCHLVAMFATPLTVIYVLASQQSCLVQWWKADIAKITI